MESSPDEKGKSLLEDILPSLRLCGGSFYLSTWPDSSTELPKHSSRCCCVWREFVEVTEVHNQILSKG